MNSKRVSGRKAYDAVLSAARDVSPFTMVTLRQAYLQKWDYDHLPESAKQVFRLLTVKLLQTNIAEPGVEE